jgi:hypothetical protein
VKEYEVYVPLRYNDGAPIERHKIDAIGQRLLEHFEGLTFFPQKNHGFWKMGSVVFRDDIVIFRVPTDRVRAARTFLRALKVELRRDLRQEEILIVEKPAETLR